MLTRKQLVATSMIAMCLYTMGQREHCAVGRMKIERKTKQGSIAKRRWDLQMKLGNEMNTDVLRKYIGKSILVQLPLFEERFLL